MLERLRDAWQVIANTPVAYRVVLAFVAGIVVRELGQTAGSIAWRMWRSWRHWDAVDHVEELRDQIHRPLTSIDDEDDDRDPRYPGATP